MKSHSLPLSAAFPEIGGLRLPIFWVKELRVILPAVLGSALCLLLSPAAPHSIRYSVLHLVYPLTCCAVFALAFGHDYMHRTITSALALPIARRKIFWTRITLCLAALLPLAAIEFLTFNSPTIWAALFDTWSTFLNGDKTLFQLLSQIAVHASFRILEPMIIALCLAPWLTLSSRSVMFGTVISSAAPYALGTLVRSVALAVGFQQDARLAALHVTISSALMLTGAILGYRRFMRLEAIDSDVSIGSRHDHKLPRATSSQSQTSSLASQIPFRRSSPILQLIIKELMLQRLPMAIALLSIAIVFTVSRDHASMLSLVYPAAIIILVGSISSADERRMGLIPSQVSHPISFHQQWLTKIAVSYTTALIFGVILPALALYFKTDELKNITDIDVLILAPFICGGVLLILSITIYISSLSENGVRAMLASLFVIIIAMIAVSAAFNVYSQYLWDESFHPAIVRAGFHPADSDAFIRFSELLDYQTKSFAITTVGFIPLALYFAMQNHRFLERSGRHLFRQAAALIGYELAALAIIARFIV